MSIDPPKAMAPAASTQIAVNLQPITLTIENASTNGVRPLAYIFEISTDAGFTTKVFTQTGVEAGSDGHTSLRLAQTLPPERTYYWRAKADDGANASDYSSPVSFQVYTPVVIQAPVLREPSDGSSVATRKPTLSVTNAQRSGPAGAIQYLFEVSTDAAIANKVISSLVNEGSDQTSYTASTDLAYETVYYWRVKAMDPGHESTYSALRSFRTPNAPPPPPVVTSPEPSPVPNPSPDGLDARQAIFMNNPSDVGSWPQTAKITSVEFTSSAMLVDFDRRTGSNRWREVPFGDGPGGIQYTLGMCFHLGGQWYCSAAVQFWEGRDLEASGPPSQIADNWYYDRGRWGPMAGHQPANGELVGIFVAQGNLRGSGNTTRERSEIIVMPFGGGYNAH